ncbi:DivIVA domain-containing protein [Sporosarcina pasteurii]|uniref:Minicell-associated protein DivIVA n=1 Tax=Sporosarcina pasteurii TaxID=1474 RepID=A0A380BFA9_SPOPA|nr:DivIVA domain-containing protein [Sporosarcina pasteurii]MDS9470512.1 DivIVA domain-containing protein [Sporosarcina pasteurii]QBQ05792.1 DivIVA domain-containing protein [Sporosarcina pasteurii]SUJ00543.1 Minicell-associated protein DivIVA [Sporosarcina pasteurii]
MALSPLDIHNKEFSSKWRGYDEDEVNEFLEQVMKDYENLIEENKTLKSELKQTQVQITHFNTIEETLQKSILTAQEAAEDVRRNSMKESKLIIKEAEKNADRIVNEALSRARKISLEIEDLKKQSKVFRNRFKMLIEAQLELVNADDWDNLLEYEIDVEQVQELAGEEV